MAKIMSISSAFAWGRKRLGPFATPENVKRVKQAVSTGKTLVKGIRAMKKVVLRNRPKKNKSRYKYNAGRGLAHSPGTDGISRSFHSYTVNAKPTYKKGETFPNYFNTFETAGGFSFASSTGTVPGTNQLNRQKVFELAAFGKCADLEVLLKNPYVQGSTAFQALDPALASTTLTGKMLYGSINGSFEFTNQEQSNLLITIYMCVLKRNLEVYTEPNIAWEAGLDEIAGPVRGVTNVNNHMPDSKPAGKYFTDRWKIVRRTTLYMPAGYTHKHYFKHTVNKKVDLSTLKSFAGLKDITLSFLVTMRGTPVDFDATQTHGPATLVGYSPSKIVGIQNIRYRTKTCAAEPPRIAYQLNNISGTAPTVVWELNDEDGKPVNIYAATNVA